MEHVGACRPYTSRGKYHNQKERGARGATRARHGPPGDMYRDLLRLFTLIDREMPAPNGAQKAPCAVSKSALDFVDGEESVRVWRYQQQTLS